MPSSFGRCVDPFTRLCLPCTENATCGDAASAACVSLAGESRCVVGCEQGCPEGYRCDGDNRCIPTGGSCQCGASDRFDLACALQDPSGKTCPGRARCELGVLSECQAPAEVCDEEDNDCDGKVDEGFRDRFGAYSLDRKNCGRCGVDCDALGPGPSGGELICGGDPLAPTCVFRCPGTEDGIQVGDRVDADLDLRNGCECEVQSLEDEAGPRTSDAALIDPNCDGADGVVVRSVYVATDGDDRGPGSPTRPLKTLGEAMRRAQASLSTEAPRPHVFVATGTYAEVLRVPDGIQVHGGYRRDFRALDPAGFRAEVRADASSAGAHGAALEIRGAGMNPTLVEGLSFQGRDGTAARPESFGAVLIDAGPALTLRSLEIRSGLAAAGRSGNNGGAGSASTQDAQAGAAPRAAIEASDHRCITSTLNIVAGGEGGRNQCGGVDVSGGRGASSRCPSSNFQLQLSGESGRSSLQPGGSGGSGGQDVIGPIVGSPLICGADVCCGPSHFSGPGGLVEAAPGSDGLPGLSGGAGQGCAQAFGSFEGDLWRPGNSSAGSGGTPGSGGGGGGAGRGIAISWIGGACELRDGLGGGGGGGGAGGCGGQGGEAGSSGGPAVALLVRYTVASLGLPRVEDLRLISARGGDGGDGGSGGEGGKGASGALGNELPRSERVNLTLDAPQAGGRGGRGGDGGDGGAGGGGCGGASMGIWLSGIGSATPPELSQWRAQSQFLLGEAGRAGRGGGGAAPAADGQGGVQSEIHVD